MSDLGTRSSATYATACRYPSYATSYSSHIGDPPYIRITTGIARFLRESCRALTPIRDFSVLGLFLIILPGLVIIRITLTLVSVVHRLQPNTELNAIRQLEWERTETLELQRQLFAAKGVDIEAVSENGRQRINGTDVESPYTTKSEAPTGLPLDSSGGKQGVSAHYAEVDESRSTSAFEPVDQGDDIADPINRYANNPEDHEMTRLGSGSSRYRRLL
ncbi:hypothetical protein B0A54_17321 [Friedmanniomyces endolithicus]|uniref:Uncharacterized protein n=1 Tax=Friedmanniomyces endolithicus TaxID=329885 RepID=A0A4U0TT77_9PEZI|nr:hypothetical protein B0A54_17321 [Friedmanniomyces endolithicus]